MDPNGCVALITGGARMGRAIGESLAGRGCDVAFTWRRSRDSAREAAAGVRALGRRGIEIQADLGEEHAAQSVIRQVVGELGRLDILVCMASRYTRTPYETLDGEAWRSGVGADLESVYRLALQATPHLRARGAGRIVTFADWLPASGRPRYAGYLPYYAAKAGVVGLTEALALELAPEVLVNAIAPGPILPPADVSADADREVLRATPLGRWGGAGEIAKAVAFLVESDFVTGETLRVDGGRHLI